MADWRLPFPNKTQKNENRSDAYPILPDITYHSFVLFCLVVQRLLAFFHQAVHQRVQLVVVCAARPAAIVARIAAVGALRLRLLRAVVLHAQISQVETLTATALSRRRRGACESRTIRLFVGLYVNFLEVAALRGRDDALLDDAVVQDVGDVWAQREQSAQVHEVEAPVQLADAVVVADLHGDGVSGLGLHAEGLLQFDALVQQVVQLLLLVFLPAVLLQVVHCRPHVAAAVRTAAGGRLLGGRPAVAQLGVHLAAALGQQLAHQRRVCGDIRGRRGGLGALRLVVGGGGLHTVG